MKPWDSLGVYWREEERAALSFLAETEQIPEASLDPATWTLCNSAPTSVCALWYLVPTVYRVRTQITFPDRHVTAFLFIANAPR